VRTRAEDGSIRREMQTPATLSRLLSSTLAAQNPKDNPARRNGGTLSPVGRSPRQPEEEPDEGNRDRDRDLLSFAVPETRKLQPVTVYAYGVARNRLLQSARRLNVPLNVVEDFEDAAAVVTIKAYYRNRPKMVVDAEQRGMPIYVLRANTVSQIENWLVDVFKLEERDHDPFGQAMNEVEQAILRIRAGEDTVDLTPQASHIRRQQHILARKAGVASLSYGENGSRHVRLLRDEMAS
jgi:hypothetical protein